MTAKFSKKPHPYFWLASRDCRCILKGLNSRDIMALRLIEIFLPNEKAEHLFDMLDTFDSFTIVQKEHSEGILHTKILISADLADLPGAADDPDPGIAEMDAMSIVMKQEPKIN